MILLDQAYCDALALKVQLGLRSVPGGMDILLLNVGEIIMPGLSSDVIDDEGWLNVADDVAINTGDKFDPVFGEFGTEPGEATHRVQAVEGLVSIAPEASILKEYGLDKETEVIFTVAELELINKELYIPYDADNPDASWGLAVNQETDYLRSSEGVTYKLNKATPLNIKLLRPIIFVFAGTRRGPEPTVE